MRHHVRAPGRYWVRNARSPSEEGLRLVGRGGCRDRQSSGGGIRTRDLRVMSPTSYLTAPPRVASRIIEPPAFRPGVCRGKRPGLATTIQGRREMAELTNLESKLGEVLGLAQAAQKATKKIGSLVEDDQVKSTLDQMRDEAAETERRATEIAAHRDGKKTAIEEKARETRSEAEEMMDTYLGDDADGLDGLEFLTMAEAGELGHVAIVGRMSELAGNREVLQFAQWALPIQQRHFE